MTYAKGQVDIGQGQMTWEEHVDLSQFARRLRIEGTYNGKPVVDTTVVRDGKQRSSKNGVIQVQDQAEQPGGFCHSILVLIDARDYDLTSRGRSRTGQDDLVGVRVTLPNGLWFDCYFDAANGLLRKRHAEFQTPSGFEASTAVHFADYQEVEGVKFPFLATTIIKGPEGMQDIIVHRVSEIRRLDKIDPNLFGEP